ncbi:uncharacterized protein LOC105178902 isoform X1 [Sesamum indicum]|uniref:Uncharacterized protein LOC105178902 isoform X1 n=1 Tax=Sesamum indicum TaxID=4182 RepID=A0A6I9UN99_SESIN|nr:uncharacterized protein LOC105178902 isoform X1 [Sesamum indicum]
MHTCMQLGSQMIHARRRDELLTCGCGSTYWRLLITRVLTRTEMRYIILLETHNQVLQDVAAGLALLRRKSFTVPTCGHVDDVLSEATAKRRRYHFVLRLLQSKLWPLMEGLKLCSSFNWMDLT